MRARTSSSTPKACCGRSGLERREVIIPRRRRGTAATEPVRSTAGRWVGGVSIIARDLAAEVAEVIGADGEFEHLVDDREKVSLMPIAA
jgi:hypothetical protein